MIPRRLCGHQRVHVFIGALWLYLTWLGGRTPSVCVQQVAGCVTFWKGKRRTVSVVFMCGSSSSRCAAKRSSFVFNLRMVCLGDDRTSTELPGRRALLKVSSKCGCCVRCLTVKTQVHSDSLKNKAKTARSRGICCICKGAQCEQGVPVQAVKSRPITLSKSWKWSLQDANQRQISQKRIKSVKTVYLKYMVTHCKRTTNPAWLRQKKRKRNRHTHFEFSPHKTLNPHLFVFVLLVPPRAPSPVHGFETGTLLEESPGFLWSERFVLHNLLLWAASQPRQAGRWRLARRWRVHVSSFLCSSPHSLSRSLSRSTPPPPPLWDRPAHAD